MIRALVLGNSHAAALIKGWNDIAARYADCVDLSFFATWEPIYRKLSFQGTVFGAHPGTDLPDHSIARLAEMNGSARVDLAAYDQVLHVGALVPDAELIETARRFDVDGLTDSGLPNRLSQPVFRAYVQSLTQRPPVRALFRGQWTTLPKTRLTLLRRPRAKDALFLPSEAPAAKIFGAAQGLIDNFLAEEAASAGLHLLPQPTESLTPLGLSKNDFAGTAPRLMGDKTYTNPDLYHMNAAYGALCLKAWLDSII